MIGTANPLIDRMRVYDPQVDGDRLERAFGGGGEALPLAEEGAVRDAAAARHAGGSARGRRGREQPPVA